MAYTRTWDASYEADPADSDNVSGGAEDIRQVKIDIRERIAKDHYMAIAGTDADHGEHKQVTFHSPLGSDPSPGANKGCVYMKDVSSKGELHYQDEDGNVTQLTQEGAMQAFPSGTKMYFYQNTAPTGWTVDSVEDRVLAVKGGSQAYNTTGGNEAGSWNQPDHTLTSAEIPAHTHTVTEYTALLAGMTGAGAGWAGTQSVNSGSAGGGGAHNHGTTYRPYAAVGIIAEKD